MKKNFVICQFKKIGRISWKIFLEFANTLKKISRCSKHSNKFFWKFLNQKSCQNFYKFFWCKNLNFLCFEIFPWNKVKFFFFKNFFSKKSSPSDWRFFLFKNFSRETLQVFSQLKLKIKLISRIFLPFRESPNEI